MNVLYQATLKYFEAQEAEAMAVLSIFFNSSIGVAGQSDFLQETKKWTQKLTRAQENMKTLKLIIGTGEENE